MFRVMLLCAGFGTRLLPLTRVCPKPLMPLGDRTVLWQLTHWLRACGIGEAVANLHHLAGEFESVLDQLPIRLKVVHEAEIRGTAGGVAGARPWLGTAAVVVHNGDIIGEPRLDRLAGAVGEQGICLAVAPAPAGQGSVGLDGRGDVVRLRGERFGTEISGGDYIGVAALGRGVVASLPDEGCLIGDVALPRLRQGLGISTVAHTSGWTDIGDLRSYLDANLAWLAEQRCRGGSWLGPAARVDPGVQLDRSVVGAGARICGRGVVSQSVVWPGATASAPLARSIVTTQGDVVAVADSGEH
jgi:mannose-1-phosphate guanylyltransferase